MEQELETLTGTVENIVYRSEETGYTVLELASDGILFTAVGEMEAVSYTHLDVYKRQASIADSVLMFAR